jgi:hypothetical protein
MKDPFGFSTSCLNLLFCCPHLPGMEGKIQGADYHPRNRQNARRDIGIDQLVQGMEQEPALVRLDASLGFEPVLQQGQGTRPMKQFSKDSPDK